MEIETGKEAMELNVTVTIPAVDKVVEYFLSSVVGPQLAPWKARQEGKAQITWAKTQARIRDILVPSGSAIQGELDISQVITQRLQLQQEKGDNNTRVVVGQAVREVGDAEVPDQEPNHDWTARFFDEVRSISSEELQLVWAKVLAGEVKRPGSTSIRTLSILRNLDQEVAVLFRRLCSACVTLNPNGPQLVDENEKQLVDVRVPSLGDNAAHNALKRYGLGFDELNILNEYGLIISDYNSWFNYKVSKGIRSSAIQGLPPTPNPAGWIRIPFGFQSRYWILLSTTGHVTDQDLRLSGVALSRSGRELSRIVEVKPMDKYTRALMEFFKGKNLQMTEVGNSLPSYSES